MNLIKELFQFIIQQKKWWLAPIIVILLIISVLVIFSESSLAPFIYSLF